MECADVHKQMTYKVCKNCRRVNLEEAEKCIGCGKKDFDEMDMTLPWLTNSEEKEDAEWQVHQRKPRL